MKTLLKSFTKFRIIPSKFAICPLFYQTVSKLNNCWRHTEENLLNFTWDFIWSKIRHSYSTVCCVTVIWSKQFISTVFLNCSLLFIFYCLLALNYCFFYFYHSYSFKSNQSKMRLSVELNQIWLKLPHLGHETYIVWLVVLSNNSILCIKGIHRVYIFTSFWLQQFYFRLNETYVEIVCFIVRPTFQGNVAQQELLMLQILKFLLLVITLAFFSLQLAYFLIILIITSLERCRS